MLFRLPCCPAVAVHCDNSAFETLTLVVAIFCVTFLIILNDLSRWRSVQLYH